MSVLLTLIPFALVMFPSLPRTVTAWLVVALGAIQIVVHLKFFPAEQSGGTAMLKALGAVYPVRFMPTGGVTPANLKEYLGLNAVIACGGTWMVPAKLIDEGSRWEELDALVREAVAAL